jgi:hypothetical protein
LAAAAIVSAQEQPPFARDYCVKVADGKGREFAAMLRDISTKLAQVRVDDGRAAWYMTLRGVVPMGSEARCDYHIFYGYSGFPAAPLTAEQTGADLRKANIDLTAEAMMARRNSISHLVNLDIWRRAGAVGAQPQKGSHVRFNYFKVKSGADWVKLETEGWGKLAEEAAKTNPGFGWTAATLAMPGAGTAQPYNAVTMDVFPDWAALGRGVRFQEIWAKVHPEISGADYMQKVAAASDRYRTEVFEVVEWVGPRQ